MSYETRETELGGFNPLAFAQKLQAGAERLATNIEKSAQFVDKVTGKVTTVAQQVSGGARTGAEVVRATTRAGIATAATGDATTGLAAASATTRPALIIGGLLAAMFVFMRHPGHKRY